MSQFDEFENEQSVAMVSVLVSLGALLLGPLFAMLAVLAFVSLAKNTDVLCL